MNKKLKETLSQEDLVATAQLQKSTGYVWTSITSKSRSKNADFLFLLT